MKFLTQCLLIIVIAYVLELFLPWYSIAIAAFIIGYAVRSRVSFLTGFVAIALLWSFKAMLIDYTSASDLADRVAQIFPVKQKIYLYLVMALLGGLVGGFAAMAGAALQPENRKSFSR
jgi:hypothetical protein